MGKGSARRPEDTEAVRRNWPFPDPLAARTEAEWGERGATWPDCLYECETVAACLGLCVVVDPTMPRDEVRLTDDRGRLLGRIVNLHEGA